MSACAAFSTCRIQYIPDDADSGERNYSDRSTIELRNYDLGNYSLRALDIENRSTEIFNIPLRNENQYKRGRSAKDNDEIRSKQGTYRLWLKESSRMTFYKALDVALQEIQLIPPPPSPPPTRVPPKHDSSDDEKPKPPQRPIQRNVNPPTTRVPPKHDSSDDEKPKPPQRPIQRNANPPTTRVPPKHDSSDDEKPKPPQRPIQRNANPPTTRVPPKHDSSDDEKPKPPSQRSIQRSVDPPATRVPPKHDSSDDEKPKPSLQRSIQRNVDPPATRVPPKHDSSDDEKPKPSLQRPIQRNVGPPTTRIPPKHDSSDDEQPSRPSARQNQNQQRTEPQKSTVSSNQNDLVADIYQLGQCIRKGDTQDAIDLAKKLANIRVQLQAKVRDNQKEERPTEVKVHIDSNDPRITKKYREFTIDVYPSTTIGELRTAFEYVENFPSSNQYFFVNGHLAYETSTMSDLKVQRDTILVLFLIQQ